MPAGSISSAAGDGRHHDGADRDRHHGRGDPSPDESGGSYWIVATFILLYGLGSGALAVARATIPLVFYDSVEFAKTTSRIALPLNLISAASSPILVGLLSNFGSRAMLSLGALCASAALLTLYWLSRHRPTKQSIAAR